jgi:hypothetical protein
MKFDNKKLEELDSFQMQCFDVNQYHQNLDHLRQMFTLHKKGVLRVNIVKDIIFQLPKKAKPVEAEESNPEN